MQQLRGLADRANVPGTELCTADWVVRQTCYSLNTLHDMQAEGKCDLAGHCYCINCVPDKTPLHNLYQNEVQCVRHLVLKTPVRGHCCSEAQVCLLICI